MSGIGWVHMSERGWSWNIIINKWDIVPMPVLRLTWTDDIKHYITHTLKI